MAPVIAEVSKHFHMNLLLLKMKKVVLSKPYMLISILPYVFLIGGRLMLDYDGNMALLKVNRHLALFRIQHYIHPGLQGISLHQCKYSLKVSSLLSCAELQNKIQG